MSGTWPRVTIVDAPNESAAVLYDANDHDDPAYPDVESRILHEGFSLGAPQLLGDVDAPGAQWGTRRLTWTQQISGSKPAALARQSALGRVLLRPRCWVRVQLTAATAPTWWHTYLSQPDELSFEHVMVDDDGDLVAADAPAHVTRHDAWRIGVALDADGFGYAARVALDPVTIGNDPASSSVPAWRVDLREIAGDAPALCRVSIEPQGAFLSARWLVMCVHGEALEPVLVDAGDGDQWVTDPTFPGMVTTGTDDRYIGGTYRSITGLDATLRRPMYLQLLDVPRGRFRALLRVSVRRDENSTVRASISATAHLGPVASTTQVATEPGREWKWVDLGPVSSGPGLPADLGSTRGYLPLSLWLATDNPSAELHVDALLLARCETTPDGADGGITTDSLIVDLTVPAGAPWKQHLDGDDDVVWWDAPVGPVSYSPRIVGTHPRLHPGTTNTLWVMPLEVTNGPTDDALLGATRLVEVSYHPRPLWLGDGQPSPLAAGTP